MSGLEIITNVVMTVSIILAGRNSVHTWWLGVLGCVLFSIMFYQVQLYADVILQLFFIVTSLLGWFQWLYGRSGKELEITQTRWLTLILLFFAGVFVTLMYGSLLHYFTDAYAPFIDSSVLAFSVIAQLLLMRRRVETWLFWLLVNSIAVPLYASRGLYLTAGLYAVYWINAVVSWYGWQRSAQTQNEAVSVGA